jgi:glycosyltransferase involved in cell wall biosynthesis
LAIGDGVPLFLYAGRIASEKNLLFLLESFVKIHSQLDQAVMVFAGDGPQRLELEQEAARLGLETSVRFAGFLDRKRLVDLYRAADVFLFASKTETQGLVIVEAMAAGTPAVAVRAMGVRDVVRDGENGFLVPEDAGALAERAVCVAADRELTARLAQGALATAAETSLQNGVHRLVEVYEESLAARPCSRWQRRPRRRGSRTQNGD